MKRIIKILSVFLSFVMFLSVFSSANPAIAAELQGTEKTENSQTTNTSENAENTADEVEVLNEITDLRDEYTKYFRQSDGSYIAAEYSSPVHYQKNGKWVEYDFTIEENTTGKLFSTDSVFSPASSDMPVKFPSEISKDGNNEISIDIADTTIAFSPKASQKGLKNASGDIAKETELVSAEIVSGDTADTYSLKSTNEAEITKDNALSVDNRKGAVKYENVFEDVNLEYEISSNVIKESIVLEKKQDKNIFEFTMDLGGLYPEKEADGSIVLYTDSEHTKAQSVITPPYMMDSNGAYSDSVSMELTPDGDKYTLTVTADKNWLNDKSRAYPVVIDPTILLDINRQNTIDCYVDNNSPNSSYPYDYYLYAGHSTLGKTRTYVKFNLPELPDDCCVIQNARLQIYQMSVDAGSEKRFISVHTVTEDWNNTTLSPTWNDQPTFASTALDYAELTYDCGDYYQFDITRAAKNWFENGNNYGVVIKGYDESKVGRAQIISAEYNITSVVYPTIVVTYRNNKGVEDYWSYSTYGVNTAGTAYVNDYTGNLVYSLPILSSSGELMPLALSAVYNNYCANERLTVGKNNSSRTTPGKGFRLSIQETVLPSDKYGLTGESKENYPYVYTDGDGTEHYIQKVKEKDKDGKETTVYKDEDGLGLTLTLNHNDCTYKITDKSDTQKCFNSEGNLCNIYDANGNNIHIAYKSENTEIGLQAKTRIAYITDGSGHKFTFTYYKDKGVELDYIETIKDNAGRTIYFTTTGGFLRSVKYYDETVTKIVYEGENSSTPEYEESAEGLINYVLSNDGYGLNFDYTSKATGRRVKKVKEFGTNANGSFKAGQIVTFDRTEYNTTVIRSAGIDGIHNETNEAYGDDDIITTLQFDNTGRTVAQQIKYGNGSFVGAGSYEFTDSSGESASLGSKNRVSSTGSMGKSVVNLLTGGNAESTAGWTHSASSPSVATEKYMGTKSLKLTNSGLTGIGNVYYRQRVDGLTNGSTYTLSAYVKVGSVTKTAENNYTGAHLQITSVGTDGVADNPVRSEAICEATDTGIDNGWRRLTATVTIPADESHTFIYLCLRNVNGTAYFDCIQLESGNAANSFNILENSSFEKSSGGLPTGWSAINTSYTTSSNSTVTNGITTVAKANGTQSVRITGDPDVAKGYSQKIYVDGKADDTYIVSGWGRGYPVNSTFHTSGTDDDTKNIALFEIAVKVTYDRTDENKNVTEVSQYKDSATFNTTITSWQYASTPFSLEYSKPDEGCTYTPKYFQIVPRYCRQVNYVYFDHLMLVKEPSQTYTYDEKGNLLKATANSEQKANAEYDDNDNMTSYTDTLGNTTKMNYDSKHNLTHTTSAKGVTTSNAYNSNGTVSVSELRNTLKHDDATLAIRTNKEYHTGGEAYGINDGAYLKYYYDEHGNATHYTYNWATGAPKTTTDANGVTTTNKYYTYKDEDGNEKNDYTRLESVSTGSSKVTYTYDQTLTGKYGGNRMSSILFGSESYGETYSFKFDEYGNTTSTYVGTQPLSTNYYKDNNGVLYLTRYGNGDTINYTYNNLGLTSIKVKSGDSTTTYKWSYDASGTLLAHTDSGTGYKYTYAYDSLGRAIRQNVTMYAGDNAGTPVSFTENVYDKANNLTKLINNIGGRTITQEYSYSALSGNAASANYAKDNLPTQYSLASNRKVTYDYDSLNRLNQYKLSLGTPIYVNYTYKMSDRNTGGSELYRTTQLSTEFINNDTYTYYYDSVGNITSIKKGQRTSSNPDDAGFKTVSNAGAYRSYEYDDLYQLTRENNKSTNETKVWSYDDLGNIESVTIYPYSTTTLSTATKTVTYDYGQENDKTTDDDGTGWNNILLGVDLNGNGTYEDSEKISYDAIGNPEKYLGNDLLWTGRELYRYENDLIRNTYYYDSDGLRSRKNMYVSNENGGYTYNGKVMYQYLGGLLTYQCTYNAADEVDTEMYFFYDSYSKLTAIRYIKGSTNHYYYVTTNMQGDVLGIYSAAGDLLASYTYDAWGNCTVNIVNSDYTIGNDNPIRYRSYYYDADTGLYYLQSRYYNPEIGRFINADGTLNGNGDIIGYNMFAYCSNNPIMFSDPSGCGKWQDFKNWVSGKISEIRIKINRFFIKTHPYETITEAAIASGINLNERTQDTNLEYGQGITYNPDTNSYGLTTTVTGEHATVDMSLILSDPSVVAMVHSHPNCNGHIGNEFSDTIDNGGIIFGDWVVAKNNQKDLYLAAPDGNLYLMVWDAEEYNQSLVSSDLPIDDTPVQCVF
ncbi:MAG: hypothetical protein IKT55_00320 [Clostridia bacterium]|nr:hypothetical protein [Clostridia bacterium]